MLHPGRRPRPGGVNLPEGSALALRQAGEGSRQERTPILATPFKSSLIAALGFVSPAVAQDVFAYGPPNDADVAAAYSEGPSYPVGSNIPQPQAYAYGQQMQRYRDQQAQYQDQQEAWRQRVQDLRAQQDANDVRQDDYDAARRAYEYERAHYDAVYGDGAWLRRYGY
jgi:hypothetical protein